MVDIARNVDVVMQLAETLAAQAAAVADSGSQLKAESNNLDGVLCNFTV